MSSDKDTLTRVQDGLFRLQKVLTPFVAERMKARFGENWLGYASRAVGSGPRDPLDLYGLVKTVLDNWRDVFDPGFVRNEKHKVRTFFSIAMEARNTTSHLAVPLTDAEGLRFLDAMLCLARAVKASKHETDALQALYDAQRREGLPPVPAAPSTAPTAAATPTAPATPPTGARETTLSLALDAEAQPAGALKPWIEVAFPQADVLGSRFKQSEFAADLAAVDMGRAAEDYQQPESFFRITFLTEGLKRVIRTALERLTGKGGDPVLGLQTSFGGGKTHTMLALHHLAGVSDLAHLPGVAGIAREIGITNWRSVKRAVFVGTAKAVDDSLLLDGGPKVRTLWVISPGVWQAPKALPSSRKRKRRGQTLARSRSRRCCASLAPASSCWTRWWPMRASCLTTGSRPSSLSSSH